MHLAVTNANVITMDVARPRAEAIAILGGRIAVVGDNASVEGIEVPGLVRVDAGGRSVVPGFVESHVHPMATGLRDRSAADCGTPPNRTIEDVVARLAAWGERPGVEVISGRGFDDSLVEDNRHLTRADLDAASSLRPVVVSHISGHLAYANSAALLAAGVGSDTEDPEGGVIARDEDGRPERCALRSGDTPRAGATGGAEHGRGCGRPRVGGPATRAGGRNLHARCWQWSA